MDSFPTFLREYRQKEQEQAQTAKTAYYSATFSHSPSSSVRGSADIMWWPSCINGVSPTSAGAAPTSEVVFLFIPGNPGLVEFYTEFLEQIHQAINKAGTRFSIFNRGHVGHAPNLPTKKGAWTVGLDAQIASTIELYDSIRDAYGPNAKVVLAGHSVGAWIVTQVMHARPDTASAAFLLFPTVSNIASTPNGRKLSWLFHHPIPTIVSHFTRLLTIPPFSLIPRSIPYISKFHNYPAPQVEVLRSLVTSPHVVYSALTMAHDEMRTIGSLGSAPSTVQATCERERARTYACFAATDEWVGDEVSSVKAMLDESQIIVRQDDVPHAFCINHSAPVAETCIEWIRDILAR
ncbi:hypothetical protein BDV93DRAFT_492759 [Ceratobasidium sp. AG-I]|nr:hypothetical protein BDV93DRAFT_492759 [Ceratobasidium sp. AG-I]